MLGWGKINDFRERINRFLDREDKLYHYILIGLVITLGGTSIYFFSLTRSPEYIATQAGTLLPNIYRLREEQALQNVKEEIKPGSMNVPILIYHSVRHHDPNEIPLVKYYDVDPSSFEKQLKYLKDNGYTVISLNYLADALKETITLPPKSVVITFDDGWENQYLYAFPLLKKYDDTATFFIFTDAINYDNFMTWDQLRRMDEAGMTIGGHTRTHPYLPSITNKADLENEIGNGKSITEKELGHSIAIFAYPFGHYTDEIIKIVKDAGYAAARSSYFGTFNSRSDIYMLRGVEVTDDFTRFVQYLDLPTSTTTL